METTSRALSSHNLDYFLELLNSACSISVIVEPTVSGQGGDFCCYGQDDRVKHKSKEDGSEWIALLDTRGTGNGVSAKLEKRGRAIASHGPRKTFW